MTPYYSRDGITIYCGDCLEVMPELEPGIDAIIADLPYGTTACSWDIVIPFEPLWAHYKRVIKKRGAVVLFGSEPFSSFLRLSNLDWYKYDWVWDKKIGANIGHARRMPLKTHENIMIFCKLTPVYNLQLHNKYTKIFGKYTNKKSDVAALNSKTPKLSGQRGFPRSIIEIMRPNNFTGGGLHPTQKPVALLEYLIKTYTNEGELVLDNTMGSGTTLVAAKNTGRRAIGIEQSEEYCKVAVDRIELPGFFSLPQPAKPEIKQEAMSL